MKWVLCVKKNWFITVLSLLFIASIILNELAQTAIVSIAVMSLLTTLAGFHIFKKAFMDLRYRIIGIDLLVSIAVIAAFIIGDFFEAAAVTYLFTLGDVLEKKSLEKTRSALKSLMDLRPATARVITGNDEKTVLLEDVQKDDLILVKPGEKIPTDGIITEGAVMVDEQMMTGESIPVQKNVMDSVYGSTLLKSGYLKMKVTRIGDDTALSRIIHMVEEAQDQKAKTQKFMEVFSKYYTPAIVLASILIFVITLDIRLAITMLVISCPGALVIATPVSFVAGIGNAAKRGILFKGGDSIERLSKADWIFFDKTGTLTEGRPALKTIQSYRLPEDELLRIAAIGESYSEHPLSLSILEAAKERKLFIDEKPSNTELIIGKGIKFEYNGSIYRIGNQKLMEFTLPGSVEADIRNLESLGQTTLIISQENDVLGLFGIADGLRKHTKDLIADLKKMGISNTVMLTGDRERVAKNVSQELGIEQYYADLLPEDKAAIIKQHQKDHHVIFVGDGINDALALSYADASVAVGGLGKDLAMETADVVLMGEDLSKLKDAIRISRKVKNNMIQNIGFALLVVLFLIIGVIFKQVSMSIGMLVHEVSVLLVLINAIRLLRYKGGQLHAKRS